MSAEDAVDGFLSRWSRRKIKARGDDNAPDGEPGPAGAPVVSAQAVQPSGTGESTAPGSPGVPLPPIEDLRGLESEYRDFLRPGVDESLRRTALKKLFQDPHFNTMDGLDTYIDDYTKADPIPEAMLRGLNQAQGLLFGRQDEQGAVEEPHDAAEGASLVTKDVGKLSSPDAAGKEDGDRSQPGPDTPSATI